MTDSQFALAIDQLLREDRLLGDSALPAASPERDAVPDNEGNFRAVTLVLDRCATSVAALRDLTDALLAGRVWHEQQELAVPLLEALLVLEEQRS